MTDTADDERGDLLWPTIPAMIEAVCAEHADHEAFVDEDHRVTYAELREMVEGAARAAMAAGVDVGDRVAIWSPNSLEWMVAALGSLAAGAAVVPLNTRYKAAEAAFILHKSAASVLFTVNGFLGTDYAAMLREDPGVRAGGLPALRHVVVLEGDAGAGDLSWGEYLGAGERIPVAAAADRAASLAPDTLSDVLFTSGTTGQPKGVMITHAQTLRVFYDWSRSIGVRAGDRVLVVNPFFHVFGCKAGFLSALMRGATVVPKRTFDALDVLATIDREKITFYPGPPTIHQAVLDHPDRERHDLSSLRLAVTGAADVSPELIRRMREELGYEVVVSGYGLTESTGTISVCQYDDDPETVARTSGRPIRDIEVEIVDDAMKPLGVGEQGEIVVRGYNVMVGYFDDPEQTAEAIEADGWLHTGDLGRLDERGYLTITGRKKDMYIVGGFNTYPAEIEAVLSAHPAVSQVAVVGVPDARLGEVGMAWVIRRSAGDVGADELIAWCRERLANYKVPRYVQFVEALPTNAAGKVLKFELAARGRELAPTRPSP